ncbi:MAG: SRPBCC family protein [Bacteroidales bacterium]|nr:SRPBCC family protein [Bacteroidales bacterium]
MMTTFESRIGKVESSDELVYNFLSDFNNFEIIIPQDKSLEFTSTEDTCSFTVAPIGKIGLKIIEREPYKLIKITGDENSKFEFFIWIQIKQVAENDTRIRVTLKADLNPLIKMMASKPLQQFVDSLIDRMENFEFKA